MMRWINLLAVVAFSCCAEAATFTAATCNLSDVNAVVNGPIHTAVDGDVIQIPAGMCTWTPAGTGTVFAIAVPVGIGITIQGVGNPTSDPTVTGADSSCSQTQITLTATTTTNMIRAFPSFGNTTLRISCMAITYGSGSVTAMVILGGCTSGGCPNFRMDNVTFNNWKGFTSANTSYGISQISNVYGVIDHCSVLGTPNVSGYLQLAEFHHGSFLGVGANGDNSWAQPALFGSANFLFIENNLFQNAGATENEAFLGGVQYTGGGRVVVRFNQFPDMLQPALTWHGTETGGRNRSGRAWEFYGNAYTCGSRTLNCGGPGGVRGGTGLTWGNTNIQVVNGRITSFWTLATYRAMAAISWGACDGTSVWDTNDGVVYFSGTFASTTTGRNPTVTVSGTDPGWTTNQWIPLGAPYSVHNVTKNTGTEIIGNGSNTLTLNLGGGGPGDWAPTVGDSFQITRATACIDQGGGRGAGFLYTGTSATTNRGLPAVSSAQVPEPSYFWSNTFSVGLPQRNVVSQTARVIGGRDYYTETINQAAQTSPTSPFDGTSTLGADGGVGHGTLANMPPTCTVNTAYWATDQGHWNHAPGGTQGQLYICTATNTWTLFYTPYTYPHPLTTTGTGPTPPTDVKSITQ